MALVQGETTGAICRRLGVSEQSYFRWRRVYGGMKVDQAWRLKELERENQRLRKAVSDLTQGKLDIPERSACRVIGQHRSTQCKKPPGRTDEEALTSAIIRLARLYGR